MPACAVQPGPQAVLFLRLVLLSVETFFPGEAILDLRGYLRLASRRFAECLGFI